VGQDQSIEIFGYISEHVNRPEIQNYVDWAVATSRRGRQ